MFTPTPRDDNDNDSTSTNTNTSPAPAAPGNRPDRESTAASDTVRLNKPPPSHAHLASQTIPRLPVDGNKKATAAGLCGLINETYVSGVKGEGGGGHCRLGCLSKECTASTPSPKPGLQGEVVVVVAVVVWGVQVFRKTTVLANSHPSMLGNSVHSPHIFQ